ncbi:MAG: SLC13 family permease [Hydrogenophilales bacterium 17-64-65]|nr:MAG: SLC13 family permease [Hydrogenophilales bacterium 16-64-40]OZA32147.1 MAG: SLC13 family permease [Hydrogenophilales bacterium 17-64-65]HQT34345.1 SLC13 family permease [Thiobacillus sp.]
MNQAPQKIRPDRLLLIAAPAFLLLGAAAAAVAPTLEILVVLLLLALTIFLFVFEVVEVDVAAISILVLIGLISAASDAFGLMKPLVPVAELFSGFSSNAVISIIAVMIIGAGLDKTGIMNRVAATILKRAGHSERRIVPAISGSAGLISGFMQNVGAAALFMPVVARIAARTGLPMSRLMMPMGFSAILGGTLTMVGSSPLILLNDLLLVSNKALPPDQQIATWSMFSVTPIGLALLASGIAYFMLAGRYVLPAGKAKPQEHARATHTMRYFRELYGLEDSVFEVAVPAGSPLVGRVLDEVEHEAQIRVVAALLPGNELSVGPSGLERDMAIKARTVFGLLASPQHLTSFVERNGLELSADLKTFAEILSSARAGIAEVVIPPGSHLIGKSAHEIWMRKTYGIAVLALHRGGKTLLEGDGIRDIPLQAGDALVVHTAWDALARLEKDSNFVIVTSDYPHEELRPHKEKSALFFFGVALFLLIFTDLRLSLALMAGAIGMILSGVLRVDEAYQAVSWKTVFLLASLIPLGLAVETSGTAAWIAGHILSMLGELPHWVLMLALAVLATFFSLVMSNVGAAVLLVPLAVNIALGVGANPAVFALAVALATSNAFLLPTHQVNALIMGPAGYRVADFIRAGGIMTLLFILVMMLMLGLFYT